MKTALQTTIQALLHNVEGRVLYDIRDLATVLNYNPRTITNKVSLIRNGKIPDNVLPPLHSDNPPRWLVTKVAAWLNGSCDVYTTMPSEEKYRSKKRGRPTKADQIALRNVRSGL